MDLAAVRDWLKGLNAIDATWTIGRVDDSREKRAAVYQRTDYGPATVAIGGEPATKTLVKHVSVLIHWTKNHRETEAAAQALYDALRYNPDVSTLGIKYIELLMPEPADVGSNDIGIFERVIWMNLHYEQEDEVNA